MLLATFSSLPFIPPCYTTTLTFTRVPTMQLTGLFKVLALCSIRVLAVPYLGFPFQEQLPTVARVDQQYSFQIANDTFLSSDGSVTYSATGLPEWLNFDTSTRTLSGTPSNNDVTDSLSFTLTGEDTEGEYSSNCTLIVSDLTGPVPSQDFTVLNQLATFGQTNGVNALVLSPGDIFNITFDAKTFTSDDDIRAYYGKSVERSPLPNWLFFDSANLRFSGVTPPANSEIAPGFQYSFRLFATDYPGFAGNFVDFGIIIGAHELTTTVKDVIHINGTSGNTVNYEIPLSSVYADGVEVTLGEISNAVLTGAPDWLSLDNYTLTGTVPSDFTETDVFNVTLYDDYSNSVTLFFDIESIDSLFAVDSFRSVNATRGTFFQYYFLSTDFTDYETTNVSVEFSNADWMTFHSDNLTVNGETPDDFDSTSVTVKASKDNSENELSFEIYGVDSITQSSSSSSSSTSHSSTMTSSSSTPSASSTTSSTSTAATSTPSTIHKSSSNNKALAIGLGVGISVFVLLVAALFLFCCFKRRSNKKYEDDEKKSPKISNPMLGNPANGPTGRSPRSNEYDDEKNITPQRLGALNVLKLDDKDYSDHSMTSSTTNVGSFDGDATHESLYHDALQSQSSDQLVPGHNTAAAASSVPKRSWRQTIDSKINRESLNSLATVSTNELFSIRLAEDADIKKDPRKSNLNFRDSVFLGSSVSSILTRDDSGNIQRLDSDGNIVEQINMNNGSKTNQRASRATNLDILREEITPDPNDFGHLQPDTSFTTAHTGSSLDDEFYLVTASNGAVTWKQSFDEQGLPQRKNSKAKLRDFTDKSRSSRADTSSEFDGETAEIESL